MSAPAFVVLCLLVGLFIALLSMLIRLASTWRYQETIAIEKPGLTEVLGNAIGDAIVKSIAKAERENTPLTELGFNWALAIALKRYWPEIDVKTAVRWLREYIEVPYGTAGYTWTVSTANDAAREYVEQFGERA